MRLNVGHLYNKPIGTSHEVPVAFDTLKIDDLLIKDLSTVVLLSRTREGILLQASGSAKVETACVRCLDEFFLPVDFEFQELYEFPSRYREETDLILPEDGYLDLSELFREYLILAIPIKRLCSLDCKGLCVVCGANLNETSCEHHPVKPEQSIIIEDEETAS